MDPVLSHHTSQERQAAAVPELPNNKPHQSPKQSHAEDHTEQIEDTSGEIIAEEQAGFRAGRSTTEQIFNHFFFLKRRRGMNGQTISQNPHKQGKSHDYCRLGVLNYQ